MTNKELADLIFPNVTKTIADYEKIYPERNLKEGAKVTRFAPSPTGYVHIGGMMSALLDFIMAKSKANNSEGVFYLRNEDTDQLREVDDAFDLIMKTLKDYDMLPDEYQYHDKIVGNYGPYSQSKRKEIYHTFMKYLIEIGRAYPCFCTKEELDNLRKNQEELKVRTGYYKEYAKCRNLTNEEIKERILNHEPYVLRFKSEGDNDRKIKVQDLVKGDLLLSENDQDIVIMKSDNLLPTYHFAHVVDDYLMRTTHVVRGEEWLSSLPIHLELFKAFGFKPPKYLHYPLILKQDGDIRRKISKRKDPEASMSYYDELGYPKKAVIESIMTIINSNYEEWHNSNKEKTYLDFAFSPKKMSSSGSLFDIDKLDNISKEIISKMTKEELFSESYAWAKEHNEELKDLIEQDEEYYKNILNIEREKKKPRKDIVNYANILDNIWYMYKDLFKDVTYDFQKITDKEEISKILSLYLEKYYDYNDNEEEWFSKVKDLTNELGYCADMKEYRNNPTSYKGSVVDVSTVLRVAITSKSMSPNLYEIMKLLGEEEVKERLNRLI